MNEEALKDAYDLFVTEGYKGSIEEFSSLLSSNPEALKDSYSLFQREGYEQPIESYEVLMGVKKKDVTESPLDDGSSVPLTPTENVNPNIQPQTTSTSNTVDSTTNIPQENLFNIDGRSVTEDEFNLQTEKTEGTGSITPMTMSYEEEFVVPKLNYEYGDQGFVFEEAGAFGDYMTVTADNGESIELNLDRFTLSSATEESKKLKDFISKNKKLTGISQMESEYMSSKRKFYNKQEVEDAVKSIDAQTVSYANDIQQYLKDKEILDEEMAAVTNMTNAQRIAKSEEIKLLIERSKELASTKKSLIDGEGILRTNQKNLQVAAGKYFDMLAQQGTGAGASYNAILEEW